MGSPVSNEKTWIISLKIVPDCTVL
jgi:hypothetical protein